MRYRRTRRVPRLALAILGLTAAGTGVDAGPVPGLAVGGGVIKGEKLDGFGRIVLRSAWVIAARTDLEVGVGAGIVQLTEESPSVRGLSGTHEVEVRVGVSRRVAPERDDLLHGWLDLRAGITRWRYLDPVPAEADGVDHLLWSALATGVGVRVTGPLGLRGGTGIRAYAGSTGDGVDNDLVETALFVEAELTWTPGLRR